ncbi:LisH domain-containing protein [Citrus sinensis]|uniref:LisH domain-containing protein n=2 Tax=Citrus TaxID=2706 RepID=A0ACB8P5K1_CITSI|nr:LisH domain-containing protein [Citrus sinensis]
MNKSSTRALKPEQKVLLLRSVAGYLKSNGFCKTLKKFLSEAQIEKDDFSDCSLDLAYMCCKYFETCDNGSTVSSKKVQDSQKDGDSKRGKEAESAAGVETVSKKKKKRSNEDVHTIVVQSEDSGELTNSKETEKEKSKQKNKRKKKVKLDSESLVNDVEVLGTEGKQGTKAEESESARDSLATETTATNGNIASVEDESVKDKGKKKKKDGSVSKSSCDVDSREIGEQKSGRTESKNDRNKTSEEDTTDKERKGSKKRKRLASEEKDSEPNDKMEVEESKRRKTEGSEELKINDDQVNGTDKNEEKSAPNKTRKKQANGSAEPKSVKAFQRVKVDEVEFTDERLKDNSYWAKDGAEIGYGAKAQEVLGQVRGRDFRHEKTKKKRGSYRGGQIDLQSHSVKFNYSDEE